MTIDSNSICRTALYSHPDIFLHDEHAAHVIMDPQRIRKIYEALAAVPNVQSASPVEAEREHFEYVHEPYFIDSLFSNAPKIVGDSFEIDRETIMNVHTLRALRLSAGAVCQAVDAVLAGHITNAFSVGYAGHHATPDHAMGFCFTNPVAIGAAHGLKQGKRVAVLDIDTHSGNGTILSFLKHDYDDRFLFAETFQPDYPGQFMPLMRPKHILRKKIKNPKDFVYGWRSLLSQVAAFSPDLILVSGGFDAHQADPLGTIGLVDEHYSWIAREILAVCSRVVVTLEGGYHIPATARCAALFLTEMTRAAAIV